MYNLFDRFKNSQRVLGTLLFIITLLPGFAQTEQEKPNIRAIIGERADALAATFLEDSLLTSLSIAVHFKGAEFIKHYGELDRGKGNKATDQTIFDLGSVSKTFVGTLVAKAEEAGLLTLEDDIRIHLNGDFSALEYGGHPIKIKHLITHTSGLPQFLPLSVIDEIEKEIPNLANRVANILDQYTQDQFLNDLAKLELDTVPGYRYNYSNAGVELMSHILERAYKKPFEQILDDEIFEPLNMPSTSMTLSAAEQKRYATGYGSLGTPAPSMNLTLWGGSGFVKSSITDVMSYMNYQIYTDDPVILKTRENLFEDNSGQWTPNIGYLWQVKQDVDFGLRIRHHGGSFGMQNWLLIYPEEELGISIITNQSGRNTGWPLWNVLNGLVEEMARHKYRTDKTETELITETIMDYIEGSTNGQPERLKKAFHPDLNLYYVYDREFATWSGADYIADTKEGEQTGEQGKILAIDYENDIATAKVEISEPDSEDPPYIDYLMLIKLQGKWVIVHKMFTLKTSE